MSVAERFAEELSTATTLLHTVHTLITGLAPNSTAAVAIQEPSYLAHTLSNLRHTAAEVEFLVLALHRRANRAADQDSDPTALRDLLSTLAADLRTALGHAHATWRELERAEEHGHAAKAAARGTRPTITATADRLAAATTRTVDALATAHTILSGLDHDYYGGRAVLDTDLLARTLTWLRQISATLHATLPYLTRHADYLAGTPTRPTPVREHAAAVASELVTATHAARATTDVLRRLEQRAHDIQQAAQGTALTL